MPLRDVPEGDWLGATGHDPLRRSKVTITRVELMEQIEAAFGDGPVGRDDLLAAATASHARPEVLAALQRPPDTSYRSVRTCGPSWVTCR